MPDPYLYEDVPVLRNKLGIKTEKILDLVEAEQSRANMMLLYERPFSSFSPAGLREIHRFLFGDIYDWAGEYRIINIQKAERLLGGRSVWYSNDDDIARDLDAAFHKIQIFQNRHLLVQRRYLRQVRCSTDPIFSSHLAGASFPRGKYPKRRDADDPVCGSARLLF